MKLKIVKLCDSATLDTYFEKNIINIGDFPDEMKLDIQTVMSIDPGTNALGFSIGRLDSKIPLFMGVINRNTLHKGEGNTDQYTVKLVEVVMKIVDNFSVESLIIEDQFLIPKFKTSFQRLTTLKDTILGRCGLRDIKTYTVKPQEWKSIFLNDIKEKYNIKMSESNKEYVQLKVRQMFMSAINITEKDATDSFGMLYFYYHRYMVDEDAPIQIDQGMPKEWSHLLTIGCGKVVDDNYKDAFELADLTKKAKARNSVKMVILNESMSLEENMRSMTSESNDIFILFTKPNRRIMPFLLKNKDKIGTITKNSEIYIIFYRTNKKGGI